MENAFRMGSYLKQVWMLLEKYCVYGWTALYRADMLRHSVSGTVRSKER